MANESKKALIARELERELPNLANFWRILRPNRDEDIPIHYVNLASELKRIGYSEIQLKVQDGLPVRIVREREGRRLA